MNGERNRSLLVPAAVTLSALAVLLGLGAWQLERKAWKENLSAMLERRLNEAPVVLPPPAQWTAITPDNWEVRRVSVRVQFLKQSDALVYTSGSAIRDDVKVAGYFVFSPALGPEGRQVVVNRGYVPARAYPASAHYIGSGSTDDARNFRCQAP